MSNCENKECGAYVNDSVVLNCGAFEDKFLLHCDAYILTNVDSLELEMNDYSNPATPLMREKKCPVCNIGEFKDKTINADGVATRYKCGHVDITLKPKCPTCGDSGTHGWKMEHVRKPCPDCKDYTVSEYKKVTLVEPKPEQVEDIMEFIEPEEYLKEIQKK